VEAANGRRNQWNVENAQPFPQDRNRDFCEILLLNALMFVSFVMIDRDGREQSVEIESPQSGSYVACAVCSMLFVSADWKMVDAQIDGEAVDLIPDCKNLSKARGQRTLGQSLQVVIDIVSRLNPTFMTDRQQICGTNLVADFSPPRQKPVKLF
jgi:hypothetical protein